MTRHSLAASTSLSILMPENVPDAELSLDAHLLDRLVCVAQYRSSVAPNDLSLF